LLRLGERAVGDEAAANELRPGLERRGEHVRPRFAQPCRELQVPLDDRAAAIRAERPLALLVAVQQEQVPHADLLRSLSPRTNAGPGNRHRTLGSCEPSLETSITSAA